MNKSPYFLSIAGLSFFVAAFFIPQWIYSKNPLYMIRGDMQGEHLFVVADYIADKYVTTVDRTQLMRDAVKGMTYSLDPWSVYVEPDSDGQRDLEHLSGDLVGIGVIMESRLNDVQVTSVIKNGPADKAGVKAEDIFMEVDEHVVRNWNNLHKLSNVVRGKRGEEVVIKFFRPSLQDEIVIKIIRDRVEIPSVEVELLPDDVLYIRLKQFHGKSARQMKEGLEKYPQAKSVIFDLRSNGGGLLEGAVTIAEYFLPKDTVVVKVKGRSRDDVIKTKIDGKWKDLRMAVLINKHSASASEVLVGAFQDHKRAIVWGEKSYGKALVQQVYPLEGGKSSLKLTTARYLTPNGNFIQRSMKKPYGLTPDKEFDYDAISNTYYLHQLKNSWKTLGIKKDFDTFIKENPPTRKKIGLPDPLVKEVLKYFKDNPQ